jgi:4-hydroxybenzoate polyprenyltransferase
LKVQAARPQAASAGPLGWRLLGVIKTVRPHQWVKNVFVLAPVVFAKEIFSPSLLLRAASAFAVFCLLAGAVYAMNDIADVGADRQHPLKRYRPIASGQVPVGWARVLAAGLIVGALGWAFSIGTAFLLTAFLYFALNVAYSLRLKHTAYLDVGCISAGFVLRVVAGGFATGIVVSNYLLLCTALLSLFLGFGKRRHEFAAASRSSKKHQRAALESYTRRGLDLALVVSGIATVVTYLVYTRDAHTRDFFRSDHLWLSTIFVMLGMMRFLAIVRGRPHAESPTQEILRDGPFVATVLFWVVLVMWMVYKLRPG